MATIIVTGAGGDVGLPVGRILTEAGHRVIGVDAGDAEHARAFMAEVEAVPFASDASYISVLGQIAKSHDADVVIPCIEVEFPCWTASARASFPARVMLISPSLCEVFSDKLLTARWLAEKALASPESNPLEDIGEMELPIIVKRRKGSGGRDMVFVNSASDQSSIQKLGSDFFAQEALDDSGGELTCGVFATQGKVQVIQIQRSLAGGITHRGEVVHDNAVETLCRAIAKQCDLEGSINVQLRRTKKGPFVFEINPRFSSTVYFRHQLGFTDVLWWLDALDGKHPPDYTAPVGARIYRTGLEVVCLPGQKPRHVFQ